MNTKLKISLLLIASNILLLLLFGGGIYYFLRNYSYKDFYKRLETRASITARYKFEQNKLNSEAFRNIREQHLEKLSDEKVYFYKINDKMKIKSLAVKTGLGIAFFKEIFRESKATAQKGNTFYTGIKYLNNGQTYVIIVSAKNYYASHHLTFLRYIIGVGILIILIITSYFSIYFSRHIFDPINAITNTVNKISTDNMHLRLKEVEHNNEIGRLVSTFNGLLNRVETAFETPKNFISNASHEFRTPLTAIIGEAEVILMKDRSINEYQQSLKSILVQAERLNQITQSLLLLAQTGYENKKIHIELLRTDEILWEVKELINQLNPKNKISIDLSLLPEDPKKLKIRGNKHLLHTAFANVLNNACKYSNNKPVVVSIASTDNTVIVLIKDIGIGIPMSEIDFIYDPFFRASNTKYFEGYGIGLPLARNIIKLHDGQLLVSSVVNEGTTVQIKIPLAQL
jgi:signal transduction histidine kinase